MKAILISLAMILAMPAFANSMTWDQIRSDTKLLASFPQINFGPLLVSADELCVDGANLRPHNPYRDICVGMTAEENSTCKGYKRIYLETPIRHTENQCVAWEYLGDAAYCTQYTSTEKDRPLSYLVDVYDFASIGSDGGNGQPLFSKSLTIPSCN